jgi:hypothetical protein
VRYLIAVAFLALLLPGAASSEPYWDTYWGTPRNHMATNFPLKANGKPDELRAPDETIAGVAFTVTLKFGGNGQGLRRIWLRSHNDLSHLSSSSAALVTGAYHGKYEELKRVLTRRYGTPKTPHNDRFSSHEGGAVYLDDTVWVGSQKVNLSGHNRDIQRPQSGAQFCQPIDQL